MKAHVKIRKNHVMWGVTDNVKYFLPCMNIELEENQRHKQDN